VKFYSFFPCVVGNYGLCFYSQDANNGGREMQDKNKITKVFETICHGQRLMLDGRRVKSVSYEPTNWNYETSIIVQSVKGDRYKVAYDSAQGVFCYWALRVVGKDKKVVETLTK